MKLSKIGEGHYAENKQPVYTTVAAPATYDKYVFVRIRGGIGDTFLGLSKILDIKDKYPQHSVIIVNDVGVIRDDVTQMLLHSPVVTGVIAPPIECIGYNYRNPLLTWEPRDEIEQRLFGAINKQSYDKYIDANLAAPDARTYKVRLPMPFEFDRFDFKTIQEGVWDKIITFQPMSHNKGTSPQWPHWQEFIDGYPTILFIMIGGPSEELATAHIKGKNVINMVAKTPLVQTCSIVLSSDLHIGCESWTAFFAGLMNQKSILMWQPRFIRLFRMIYDHSNTSISTEQLISVSKMRKYTKDMLGI